MRQNKWLPYQIIGAIAVKLPNRSYKNDFWRFFGGM